MEMTGFWMVIVGFMFFFFLLSLREVILIIRMRQDHPERGLYWFNSFFLLLCSVFIYFGAYYLDASRVEFEALMKPYPEARYAHERNSIIRKPEWVYVSQAGKEEIWDYFKAESKRMGVPFVDNTANDRMAFELSSGTLYLTLSDEAGVRVLYFSQNGTTTIIQ